MKIAFRVDASLEMGTGHVMRCLTLADALTKEGLECHFICREHPGNLMVAIEARGHHVHSVPITSDSTPDEQLPSHAHWLGSDWRTDAEQARQYLQDLQPDWLVVDHYGLDVRWEQQLRPVCNRLMVIDDLADRVHDCDLLLDQTFGREVTAYKPWVPSHCTLLVGSTYALLRPEFSELREYSLARRDSPKLRNLLITMGGVDKDNATGDVLAVLQPGVLPEDCHLTVVMGATAPWLASVQEQAAALPWTVSVRVNVTDMATLMADSDLAIGAAGSTSWERAAVGLPSLLVVTASNQALVAESMMNAGAVVAVKLAELQDSQNIGSAITELMTNYIDRVVINSGICDGRGASRIASLMRSSQSEYHHGTWLRDALLDDCELVYRWQKQPGVRRFARNPEVPVWREHQVWYAKKIQSEASVFKIIMSADTPVGVVRLDSCTSLQGHEVSVYIATEHCGHGFASNALSLTRDLYPDIKIIATVLADNQASHALFRKSGYTRVDATTYVNAVSLEKER
ncbi:MAG: UDP-2,4-diacetamido-2,4,6-trideoxy-beta-L-altropyranose hydrolase [Motiliproteus sp.]